MNTFISIIISGFAICTAISVHEFGHAYAAYKLGDCTAKYNGRMTLNPIAHIDIIGLIFLIIARFGWAKPVPIDESNFKKPRRDVIIVSAAGAIFNILTAILFVFMIKVGSIFNAPSALFIICNQVIAYNIGFAAFNLFIPIAPLDGWRIINSLFKLYRYEFAYKMEQYGFFIFMLLYVTNILPKILIPINRLLLDFVYLFLA